MRIVFTILGLIIVLFLIEFMLFNLIGGWIVPNLLLLLIMFADLYWGIRFGIIAAVMAGMLKDSFGTNAFGVHLLSFVACAYLTVVIKRFIYYKGSRSRRLILVFVISTINVFLTYLLLMVFGPVHFWQTIRYVLIPEVFLTLLAAPLTFEQLKICASKLSV